jgi:hypothetical protein
MHHRVVFTLLICACSPTSPNNPDAGNDAGPADSGSDGSLTNGTWTQVIPIDQTSTSTSMSMAQTVTGFHFTSLTDGVVSFQEGLIEHFSSATTIDKIVLDGTGKLPGPNDDSYYGFISGTSLGLIARNDNATKLVTSPDGKTWTYQAAFKSATAPQGITQNFPLAWAGTDKAGGWHDVITAGGGDVYSSSGPLGPTAVLTDTWHPAGVVTVPATIPAADCTDFTAINDYPGQQFMATTDGSAFVYTGNTQAAVCLSTDNGKTFTDVTNNIPASFLSTHHYAPAGYLFTSPTVGIGYYGSELDTPGSAYVLYTIDAGKDWLVGTLPTAAQNSISLRAAFASPTGTLFIVGGGNGLVFFKSVDGGKTWTDLSAKISDWAIANNGGLVRLFNGFAFDDQHIWVGSDSGFIAFTATGGQ